MVSIFIFFHEYFSHVTSSDMVTFFTSVMVQLPLFIFAIKYLRTRLQYYNSIFLFNRCNFIGLLGEKQETSTFGSSSSCSTCNESFLIYRITIRICSYNFFIKINNPILIKSCVIKYFRLCHVILDDIFFRNMAAFQTCNFLRVSFFPVMCSPTNVMFRCSLANLPPLNRFFTNPIVLEGSARKKIGPSHPYLIMSGSTHVRLYLWLA